LLSGVYGDDYYPVTPKAVIEMTYNERYALPVKLKEAVSQMRLRTATSATESPERGSIESISASSQPGITLGESGSSNPQLFVIFHGMPSYSECQKFSCSNYDEFNVMYHAWMFPQHELGSGEQEIDASNLDGQTDIADGAVSSKITCGCFEPIGVRGVHLDLKDAGMPINEVKNDFSVVIHDISFSPSNLMLQLTHTHNMCSFWTFGYKESPSKEETDPFQTSPTSIVCLHLFPATEDCEQQLTNAVKKSNTLGELIANIEEIDRPEISSTSSDSNTRASTQLTRLFESVAALT
jgi:hypothetical protein